MAQQLTVRNVIFAKKNNRISLNFSKHIGNIFVPKKTSQKQINNHTKPNPPNNLVLKILIAVKIIIIIKSKISSNQVDLY